MIHNLFTRIYNLFTIVKYKEKKLQKEYLEHKI